MAASFQAGAISVDAETLAKSLTPAERDELVLEARLFTSSAALRARLRDLGAGGQHFAQGQHQNDKKRGTEQAESHPAKKAVGDDSAWQEF